MGYIESDDPIVPRDPKKLVREIDAVIKITDIRTLHRYREQLEGKWYEPLIVSGLFVSGLGFVVTIFKLIPTTDRLLFWFVFGWFVLFVLTLIAAVEFLLVKIAVLRRLHEFHGRLIEELARAAEEREAGQGAVGAAGLEKQQGQIDGN